MRNRPICYPVDRYLVESSKKLEMVNIIDDDIWNTEPALRPEDEIILRKLHDMLQSTADDLKLLSGELSKFHEPGVQVKTSPTPLDEDFNERVHIEEIVNAKFHGHKIIDKPFHPVYEQKLRNDVKEMKSTMAIPHKTTQPKISNSSARVNTAQILKRPSIHRNLGISRTKILQIDGNQSSMKTEKLNNGRVVNAPTVAYNEFSYEYVEPKVNTPSKLLQVQEMPSINIRSELKEQKVLHLDIIPESKYNEKPNMITKNIAVVAIEHGSNLKSNPATKPIPLDTRVPVQYSGGIIPSVRKVSKLSAYESSESSNNISTDARLNLKTQNRPLTTIKTSPKTSMRSVRDKILTKKVPEKRSHLNMEEWKKKLNSVYGTLHYKKNKSPKSKGKPKVTPKKSGSRITSEKNNILNNAEYIPYSQLTIGGARASDIEREISDIPNKNEIPLNIIVDKILSSRENSFSKCSPRKQKPRDSPKIFTTSDENLLQEVIDIERTVSETLSKDLKKQKDESKAHKTLNISDDENDSYADDFEDEKSDNSGKSRNSSSMHSNDSGKSNTSANYHVDDNYNKGLKSSIGKCKPNIHNQTYTKASSLSFKNTVDIYEFVHSVDTQDSATQSNTTQKISPKETQTSPRIDRNIQPIHNNLWPSVDPMAEVEKMFKIEKELIKKLIVEEYGDLLEKNISKPSTSSEAKDKKNSVASQKNTQTSPAHVKHVMTSPTQTKTRTTSPFAVLAVDHHTSPIIFVTTEDNIKVQIEEDNDVGISINLSSPRFSLRLPQNSREFISNLEDTPQKAYSKKKTTASSTTSVDIDSSEISSLGEVKLKLGRKIRKGRLPSSPDSTCSSSTIHTSDLQSGIIPLRSEGEMSFGCIKSSKHSKSEGEF